MLWVLLALFALAALAGAIHRRAPGASGWWLALLPAAITAYLLATAGSGAVLTERYPWVPSLGLELSFFVDGLSRLFALLICGIGAIVLVYAGEYLKGHQHLGRLYILLLVFLASMLGIVVSDNLILLFVFWELTSISSYLLIGFNHDRPAARKAALQALLITGGGGLALLAGALLLAQAGGSYEISTLLGRGDQVRAHALYPAALALILLGAFTKSAQAPFHFWLPAAMEAPTPVSAYLHSSTMVKAGVFLLARLAPIIGGTAAWAMSLTAVGAITMTMAAWLAFRHRELKRLLAYSTVSALGVMTMLIGLDTEPAAVAAVVFLMAHGLYKGALFLVAGAIDHETGERDIRRLGGLRRAMPFTAAAGILAALSMAGIPPLVGFVGKELALEAARGTTFAGGVVFGLVVLTGALLVAASAMVASPFFGARPASIGKVHEGAPALWLGALLLAVLGLVSAVFPQWITTPTLAGAASAVRGAPVELTIHLWHGWTLALAASGAALAAGIAMFRWRDALRETWGRLPAPATPTGWYEASLDGLSWVAAIQTRALQSGYLRYYLAVTIGVAALLVGETLVFRHGVWPEMAWVDIHVHEAGIAALMGLAALGAVRARSRFGAVAALGSVGFSIALIFAMFGAPDLAMTQFLVEALTVILLVLVLYNMPAGRKFHGGVRWRDLGLALSAGVVMTALVLAVSAPGGAEPVSGYFVEHSLPDAHGRNVVNVILVDFRAIDTLGEISVLGIAAIGVFALLRLRPDEDSSS
jgi:multicomponent Na+:H+ antiporter subunit A